MGGINGCGCKKVYRFPHITYPYSSCICSFLQQHPYFLFFFKNVFWNVVVTKEKILGNKRTSQSCIQNMWLGGQTESFQNVGG